MYFVCWAALAMFLFGMDTMSKSLQKQAGGKLQKILGAFTGNPLKGFCWVWRLRQ